MFSAKQTKADELCATVTKKNCVYFLKVTQGAVTLPLVGARWVESSRSSQEQRCYLPVVVPPGFQWKQTAGCKDFEYIHHRRLNICCGKNGARVHLVHAWPPHFNHILSSKSYSSGQTFILSSTLVYVQIPVKLMSFSLSCVTCS